MMKKSNSNGAANGRDNEQPTKNKPATGMIAGSVARTGALVSAMVASACCWLPLLLLAFGVSGGALSATFEAWRPVLLPLTFVLLGIAFYFTYRKPKALVVVQNVGADVDGEGCCPPGNARRFTLKGLNKVMLWVVTVLVVAFAFFPNYGGLLLGGGCDLASWDDLDKLVVKVEGMTCEVCAVTVEKALLAVPGVAGANVSYEKGEALIGVQRGAQPSRTAILKAISEGGYKGRFASQAQTRPRPDSAGSAPRGCCP